jgi:pilus assembly protein CpaD
MIDLRPIVLVLACALTAACAGPGDNGGMVANADVSSRHPIELREDSTKLELYAARGLDARARAQVAEFAAAYQRTGTGPIVIMLPSGTMRDKDYRRQFDDIRHVLIQNGLRGSVKLGAYPVMDPRVAAPVQMSFMGLKARVPGPCGQWPDDLASGSSVEGFSNAPYQNFGCATQAMIAAQAADPRDLMGARAALPSDAETRVRPISNLRRGVDPASSWQVR